MGCSGVSQNPREDKETAWGYRGGDGGHGVSGW